MKFRDRRLVIISLITVGVIILTAGLFYWKSLSYDLHWDRYKTLRTSSLATSYSQAKEEAGYVAGVRKTHQQQLEEKAAFITWPDLQASPQDSVYPVYTPLLQIIETWNPDNPEQPHQFVETLQHFNYSDPHERRMAEQYRNAEVPFKVYDVPEFDALHIKWNDEYLSQQLRHEPAHVEKSKSNHFMYWTRKNAGLSLNFKPPTESVSMSYTEFLNFAERAKMDKLSNSSEHYYFMTGSKAGDRSRSFVARDLFLFSTDTPNFFITDVVANKGIQCRFGMRGVIAEAHFDAGRNFVAMLKGSKRYILTPPESCMSLAIISDTRHPSYRHSMIDWSDPAQAASKGFNQVNAIDTIVRTGELLYIPSYWFHYIISLDTSIQCNSRSGSPPSHIGESAINNCLGKPLKQGKRSRPRH